MSFKLDNIFGEYVHHHLVLVIVVVMPFVYTQRHQFNTNGGVRGMCVCVCTHACVFVYACACVCSGSFPVHHGHCCGCSRNASHWVLGLFCCIHVGVLHGVGSHWLNPQLYLLVGG